MEHPSQQPLELHCQAIVHLAPGTFEIRGGKELFINTLQAPPSTPEVEELTALRAEVAALRP